MAHGQTAPVAVQASPTQVPRQPPGRTGPRGPHTGRPRSGEEAARRPGTGGPGVGGPRAGEPLPGIDPVDGQWPGTTGSAQGTPPRRPGSVRRTTSIMMERPDGLTGPLHLTGVGRDLLTTATGETRVLGEARLRVVLDYMAAPGPVLEIESEPAVPGFASLVGASARAGFRGAARQILAAADAAGANPADGTAAGDGAGAGAGAAGVSSTRRSLLEQLLDDVPVATLVSGSALGRNGIFREKPSTHAGAEAGGNPMLEVCAGWQRDGLLARLSAERSADSRARVRTTSVRAGDLALDEDPLGWHPLPPLGPHAMRRLRRIDLVPIGDVPTATGSTRDGAAQAGPADGAAAFQVDALMRDTYQEPAGAEVVVHEYGIDAAVDQAARVVRSVGRAGVLPGPECPQALASAERVVGLGAADLRRTVSRTFTGTTTCTHLNDTLRALGDLPDLIERLRSATAR
ncbi:DUF2889 domain-containing protein [Parafrankia discariae]|uniref:DUF2889 domain-containing protein n=1 Tax=Parafrankia discariae TaxID=365528 RepID=UPI000378A090|nr:DUF2889 domain-containing protein [Parafrankia discariae]